MSRSARFGIDIGGTFTDVVLQVGAYDVYSAKVLSTPHYYGEALVKGIWGLLQKAGVEAIAIDEIIHATTIVTNAILQRSGARVGLLTTAGFRDVLELGRMRVPTLYNLMWDKPAPLVPRNLRLGIDERIGPDGAIIHPLDIERARASISHLREAGVDAVAICLLHSYLNPVHEQALRDLVAQEIPGIPISVSSSLTPDIGEYERTSTTVVNAYAQPLVKSYLDRISEDLRSGSINCSIRLMQSNGDSIGLTGAVERPVNLVESGGAAGVIAARHVARHLGYSNTLVFDMGGTSTKATLIENGELTRVTEFEIGADISMGSRMSRGGGYPLMVSAVDVAEVGAGGGSIAWIDAGGALKVGPRSAGASPGPACYGHGGSQPTVTDANVALGYLPTVLAGDTLRLDRGAAIGAIESQVALPLGMNSMDAALGIRNVAISTMVRAARAVSVERGHDVRNFTMIAFGGSGPLHAMDVALALGINRVIVPRLAGLLSATGLLVGDHGREFIRAIVEPVDKMDLDELDALVKGLERDARSALTSEGTDEGSIQLTRAAVVRYGGQQSDLIVPLSSAVIGIAQISELKANFHAAHMKAFGHSSPDEPVVIVKVIIRAHASTTSALKRIPPLPLESGSPRMRAAYFGSERGSIMTPVFRRVQIPREGIVGPAVVEDDDCTTLVPVGCRLTLDSEQNLTIETASSGEKQ
jgi:N-methylhydantoinase A